MPDLFFVECANILWKYARHFGYPFENAHQDVLDLQALRLRAVSTADLVTLTLDIALTHNLTAYDACYAALAQEVELPLITAEAPLVRKLANSEIDARLLSGIS